jgi:hypothetical protein
MKSVLLVGCAVLLVATGCDTSERIAKIEKQNKELEAQVSKRDAAVDYDLQAKCSKDAKVWFHDNWQSDGDTVLLNYTNHYNKAMNKCFVMVEYHYTTDKATGSWANLMSLWDMYENAQFADFAEHHYVRYKPKIETSEELITCKVAGTKCTAIEQFNSLVRPYLSN